MLSFSMVFLLWGLWQRYKLCSTQHSVGRDRWCNWLAVVMCLLECTILVILSQRFLCWCNRAENWCWPRLPLESCSSSGGLLWCGPTSSYTQEKAWIKTFTRKFASWTRVPSNIHYFFKHGRKVCFGFPRNVRAEFGLVFPVTRSCVFLSEGRRWLPVFICCIFLNGILALLSLWFSNGLHTLCSCTPCSFLSSLRHSCAECFYMGLLSDTIVKKSISPFLLISQR